MCTQRTNPHILWKGGNQLTHSVQARFAPKIVCPNSRSQEWYATAENNPIGLPVRAWITLKSTEVAFIENYFL